MTKGLPFRTSEHSPNSLSDAIRAYLNSSLGKDQAQPLEPAIEECKLIAKEALSVCKSKQASDPSSAILHLLRYYATLNLLGSKLPFAKANTGLFSRKVESVSVLFQWVNSVDDSEMKTSFGIRFEKASILYNIAACFSQAAAALELETAEQAKEATVLCLKSTSAFKSLEENLALRNDSDGKDAPMELTVSGAKLCQEFMLAQAAETTFINALKKDLSAKTLTALAAGVSAKYSAVLELCEKDSKLKEWTKFKFAHASLFKFTEFQVSVYQATSQYWASKVAGAGKTC
jgi:hypothetical protein